MNKIRYLTGYMSMRKKKPENKKYYSQLLNATS